MRKLVLVEPEKPPAVLGKRPETFVFVWRGRVHEPKTAKNFRQTIVRLG